MLVYQYFAKDKISKEAADLLAQMDRRSAVFLEKEIEEILERFDPGRMFPSQFRLKLQEICNREMMVQNVRMNVTDAMMQLQYDLRDLQEKQKDRQGLHRKDTDAILDRVQELVPFAYKSFQAADAREEL